MTKAHPTVLQNEHYRIEVDPENGAVRSLLDRAAGLELIAEPRLAESFRLMLPLSDDSGTRSSTASCWTHSKCRWWHPARSSTPRTAIPQRARAPACS